MNIAVIKISGKALNELFTNDDWIQTFCAIKQNYDGLVIVHGAGQNISEWSNALGLSVEFRNGQRVTSEDVMDVVAAVQSGVLNSKIVSRLVTSGLDAVGLSGIDRGSFSAEKLNDELGYVGVPQVTGSIEWIYDLLNKGVIPVFSSICRNSEGKLMNVNADIFTEVLASSLQAESVFFVSDVVGVMLGGNIKYSLSEYEIMKGISSGEITGGMIPKLTSCVELLNNGVGKVWIGSKIFKELFNGSGNYSNGTWIIQSA